ncbi:MAG: hypothetical protein AAGD23_13170 [Pseudomonadota bacterium]
MTERPSETAQSARQGFCLTELSVTTLVATALGASALLWLLIFAVI